MADFRQLFWIEQDKYLFLNKRKIPDETEMTTDITIADRSWWPCHGSGLTITREMGGLSICRPSSQINVCEDYRTKECRAERDTIRLENFLSPQGVLESGQRLFTEPSRSVETCTNSGCWGSHTHTRGQLFVALFCVQNWWSTEASGRSIQSLASTVSLNRASLGGATRCY